MTVTASRAATHLLALLQEGGGGGLVTMNDLWKDDQACPREVFGCFLVELTLEEGSQRLTLRRSAFWRRVDGQRESFQACSRRVFNFSSPSMFLIRWSFRYKHVNAGNWRRDLYVMSNDVNLTSPVRVLIVQRRTRAQQPIEQAPLERMKISFLTD